MAIILHLRQLRLAHGWTIEDVARILQRSTSYVSKMENGQRRLCTDALEDFARLYGVPPCQLLTYSDLPQALRCACHAGAADAG